MSKRRSQPVKKSPAPKRKGAKRARCVDDDDDDHEDEDEVRDGDGDQRHAAATAPVEADDSADASANMSVAAAARIATASIDHDEVGDDIMTTSARRSVPSSPFLVDWEIRLNGAIQTGLLATSNVYVNVYMDDSNAFSGFYQITVPITRTTQSTNGDCYAIERLSLLRTLSACDPRVRSLISYRPALYDETGARSSMLDRSIPWLFIKPQINFVLISHFEERFGIDVLVSTKLPASRSDLSSSVSVASPSQPESTLPERITTVGEALDRYHRYKAAETRLTTDGIAPKKKDIERFTSIARNSHATDKAIFTFLSESERKDLSIRQTTVTVMKEKMKSQ
jgi:hypothetical protein